VGEPSLPVDWRRSLASAAGRLSFATGRLRLDVAYLVLALTFGLLFALLTPPFQNPDEPAHYYRAWSLAEGQLVLRDDSTVVLPQTVTDLPAALGSAIIDWSKNTYSPDASLDALDQPIGEGRARVFCSAGANGPLGYLPSIAAVDITRLFGRSPLSALYLARVMDLLAAVFLTFLAIRIAPFGKPLFAFAALLPMTVSQYASLSPDALAISGAFLFTGLVLRCADGEHVKGREIALLVGSGAILLNMKQSYAVFALLVFLIPPSLFGSLRRYAASLLAVLGSVAVVAIVPFAVAPSDAAAIRRLWGPGFEGDSSAQIHFVVQHPWAFVKALGATLDFSLVLLQQAAGVLGWLTVFLPQVIVVTLLLLLALLFAYREEVDLRTWQRGVLAVTAASYILVVMAALYVAWSPLASPVVAGLQGRYFIAVLPVGLLAVYRLTPGRRLAVATLALIGCSATILTLAALIRVYYR
jgi:uncharacterized membrane protein